MDAFLKLRDTNQASWRITQERETQKHTHDFSFRGMIESQKYVKRNGYANES